jgi:hypothetical protein
MASIAGMRDQSTISSIRARMRRAGEQLSLPFRRGLRHSSGHVAGRGTGSSLDFQDHRPYAPGDDPRHIDWRAYARTGHYTMKLFRDELRPLVDLALDLSPSMRLTPSKRERSLELVFFCAESALRHGASLHLFGLGEGGARLLNVDSDFGALLDEPGAAGPFVPTAVRTIPWRTGSMRVVISDLLFPGEPTLVLHPLVSGQGRPTLLVPHCVEESDPDWIGNAELADCESADRRSYQFEPPDLVRYAAAYHAHFDLWQSSAASLGVTLARVASELDFLPALQSEALRFGAVEFC